MLEFWLAFVELTRLNNRNTLDWHAAGRKKQYGPSAVAQQLGINKEDGDGDEELGENTVGCINGGTGVHFERRVSKGGRVYHWKDPFDE